MFFRRSSGWVGLGVGVLLAVGLLGCERGGPTLRNGPAAPVEDQPASAPATQSAPAEVATAPASRPVEALPPSTYNPEPPYLVDLHVRDPEAEQPGWLRIIELNDQESPAAATGTFPRKNHLDVETRNVKRVRVHIDHLPRDPNKRTFLRIDDQPIELLRKNREYIYLERRPIGQWVVVPEEDE